MYNLMGLRPRVYRFCSPKDILDRWRGSEQPPLSSAEPYQALGLPDRIALSSWQVRAMYIIPNLCQANSKSGKQALRGKSIYTK